MEHDEDNFLSFFALLPPNHPENQNFEKKWRKCLEISFYTNVPKIMIICSLLMCDGCNFFFWSYCCNFCLLHCFWETRHDGCNFYSFWAIFFLITSLATQKSKIFKKWKNTPGDIIILHVYQKLWSYYLRFMKCGVWQTYGRTDGWTDGQTNRRSDRLMDWGIDKRTKKVGAPLKKLYFLTCLFLKTFY